MADVIHDTQHGFWRPPANQPVANLADACRRCSTEFMVGAAFCHICGANRHRANATPARNWAKHLEFARAIDFAKIKIRNWLDLPLPSLCAFVAGVLFLMVALGLGLMSVRDPSDFEAIQFWRIEWLITACAAFLGGILLKTQTKNRKPEN
jgi:hypothetical protein